MTRDGGYAAAGRTSSFGAGMHDFYLVKTDERGEVEWQETYGTESTDWGETLIQTEDGGYLLGGTSKVDDPAGNIWIVRVDADGELLWENQFGGGWGEDCNSLLEQPDGGFVLSGVGGPRNRMELGDNFYIVRMDSAGEFQWELFLGTPDSEKCYAGFRIENNSFAFCGEIGRNNFWIVKTGPDPVLNGIIEPPEVYYPGEILLQDIYPNPFNSTTTISYTLPYSMSIELGAYDIIGRKLNLLENMYKHAGKHQFIWNARDFPSGQYLIRLETKEETKTKNVMLIR